MQRKTKVSSKYVRQCSMQKNHHSDRSDIKPYSNRSITYRIVENFGGRNFGEQLAKLYLARI